MLIITKVQKLPVQEYMIYYILAGLIGLASRPIAGAGRSAGGISLRALRRHQLPMLTGLLIFKSRDMFTELYKSCTFRPCSFRLFCDGRPYMAYPTAMYKGQITAGKQSPSLRPIKSNASGHQLSGGIIFVAIFYLFVLKAQKFYLCSVFFLTFFPEEGFSLHKYLSEVPTVVKRSVVTHSGYVFSCLTIRELSVISKLNAFIT